jgi:2-phospho-L-lactate guanylyltransferase
MQATAFTFDPETGSGSVLTDDGDRREFDGAAFAAGGLRLLRVGQRVRIEVDAEGRISLVTLQTF